MKEIVIKIDENIFTRLFDNGMEDYAIVNDDLFAIAKAIRKCTPLPEGHGRLIDADALLQEHRDIDAYPFPSTTIQNAPTIIEGE